MPRSQKSNQKRKVWILIALLVVAGVITGVVLIVKNKDNSKKSDSYENMLGQSEHCNRCIRECEKRHEEEEGGGAESEKKATPFHDLADPDAGAPRWGCKYDCLHSCRDAQS